MSAKSQPEDRRNHDEHDEPRSGFDHIERPLKDRINQDQRFDSGVPEHHRPTDLDFILMSGLTRPAPDDLLEDENAATPPGDVRRPLSVFEPAAPPRHDRAEDTNIIRMRGDDSEPDDLEPETPEQQEPAAPEAAEDVPEPELPDETGSQLPEGSPEDTSEVRDDEPAEPESPPGDEPAGYDTEVSMLIDQYLNEPAAEPEQGAVSGADNAEAEPVQEPDAETGPELDEAETDAEVEPEGEAESDEPEPVPPETDLAPAETKPETSDATGQPHEARFPDLTEAEMFVHALETQPRDTGEPVSESIEAEPEPPEPPAEPFETDVQPPEPVPELIETAAPEPQPADMPAEDALGEVAELPVREPYASHRRRRSGRSSRRLRRRVARLAAAGIALAAAAVAAVGLYLWLEPVLSTPEARLAAAHELAGEGSYSEASSAFTSFAQSNPQHPARAEAQFLAAHYAGMAPAADFDAEQAAAGKSLALFETFLRDNPTHVKAARAWTMVAQLHYKLGQYEQAVNILRDPVLRLRDPESALPGLRTLARSHARLGDFDGAVSAYQQAAAFAGNYAPDADYDALGDLFKLMADRADDPVETAELQKTAVENWQNAIRVPGIDPANKAKIQDKIKWLESQIAPQQQAPASGKTSAVAAAPLPGPPPAQDRNKAEVDNAAALPPAGGMDPAAEARFLSGGGDNTQRAQENADAM